MQCDKRLTLLFCISLLGSLLFAQQHTARICYDKTCYSEISFNDSLVWFVNGVQIAPDTIFKPVVIHWPKFDTVRVINGTKTERVIITRFSPDSSYYLIPYGCCSDLDISSHMTLSDKQQRYLDSLLAADDFTSYIFALDSIYIRILEKGTVIFHVLHATSKDSLGGTFGKEHGPVTGGRLLINNAKTQLGYPFKVGLNGGMYCFKIRVGRVQQIDSTQTNIEDNDVFFQSDKTANYYSIVENYFVTEYRFLRPETILITVDARTKKCTLEIGEE